MLNLAEYRQRPALLADWLPWAGLIAPGVAASAASKASPVSSVSTAPAIAWRTRWKHRFPS